MLPIRNNWRRNKDEAIEALKHYTDLSEQEINQIIDEIIEFNKQFKKRLTS